MSPWSTTRFILSLACALAAVLAPLPAAADLMLHPTRVVLEKNQRAAQVELINSGTETTTYRISIVNRRMGESGDFSAIDTARPGEQFADEMLRFSPRQVTIPPSGGQTVRILLRKPPDLPAGEYRSHMQIDRVGTPADGVRVAGAPPGPGEVGVQLRVLVGVSIPLIVRQGETTATLALSGLELLKPTPADPPVIAAVMQRSGNRSVYGDLVVSFTPAGGAAVPVGKAAGVAVYTPNAVRRVKLALQPPAGLQLARGTLRLAFMQRPEEGGKQLAETSVQLP